MSGLKLKEFLDSLKEQIEKAEFKNQNAHEQVTSTMMEADRMLQQGELEANGVSTQLTDQFSQLATEVEAEHPHISATIGSIIDILGRIGV